MCFPFEVWVRSITSMDVMPRFWVHFSMPRLVTDACFGWDPFILPRKVLSGWLPPYWTMGSASLSRAHAQIGSCRLSPEQRHLPIGWVFLALLDSHTAVSQFRVETTPRWQNELLGGNWKSCRCRNARIHYGSCKGLQRVTFTRSGLGRVVSRVLLLRYLYQDLPILCRWEWWQCSHPW